MLSGPEQANRPQRPEADSWLPGDEVGGWGEATGERDLRFLLEVRKYSGIRGGGTTFQMYEIPL